MNEDFEIDEDLIVDDGKGYVIRMVDQFDGRVIFQGAKGKLHHNKDVFRPQDTFTLAGARKSLANISRLHPDVYFLSIERLSCYYSDYREDALSPEWLSHSLKDIEYAMVRLDELRNGNEFDDGDKMRINQVRYALNRIKENLLRMEW